MTSFLLDMKGRVSQADMISEALTLSSERRVRSMDTTAGSTTQLVIYLQAQLTRYSSAP